jgi:maltose O-acetyltransferase
MIYRFLAPVIWRLYRKASDIAWNARYERFYRKYELDPSFWFNGWRCSLYGPGRIIAGPDSYIGEGTTIKAAAGRTVRIGRGAAISHAVRVYTENRDPDADQSVPDPPYLGGDVTIGDYVWIGANVFVPQGVTIGDHAVVGANSIVTKDVEPYMIVGGVPARPIRRKRGAPAAE